MSKNKQKKFGFTKKERIHFNKEFLDILKNGKKEENEQLRLYYKLNNLEYSRIGIIINKKFGKANERNKAKRVIRELFRTGKYNLKRGYDLIFYIKPLFKELSFVEKKNVFMIC